MDWQGIVNTKKGSKISYGWRCQEQDGTDNQHHSYELNQNPVPVKEHRVKNAYQKVQTGSSDGSHCQGLLYKAPRLPTLILSSSHLPLLLTGN